MSNIILWLASQCPAEFMAAMKIKANDEDGAEESDLMKATPTADAALNYLALKWFVQSYTWCDITATVWVGPRHTHLRCDSFYSPLLHDGHLQLEKFMGCQDWVLYAILRVSNMEERLLETVHKPTEPPLKNFLNEAEHLCHELEAGLRPLLAERNELSFGPRRDSKFVTELYIHAALVYLHVVTIGSRSDDPTLRHYVARGLLAYENLPRRLDIHIALPFGVLASMADEEEGRRFLGIAESPRHETEVNPGQMKTLPIVKETLRLRKIVDQTTADAGVSWRDGAASLGLTLLPA
ncbi:hypothetical protein GE09DRAFT_284026 [Coniochaeta sp. 2T2.1]|nr:hypothetical protein GE09DRAFT_284026 [Coniochaeta sp. 2T2.1]